VTHDIPARSRLLPVIPITSQQFVYRKAGDTDLRVTFARARADLGVVEPPAPDPERTRSYVLTPPRVTSRAGR
jgi:hypothetical protein